MRDFGTLELDNKQPAKMTLRSVCDEPLPLRLFWSPNTTSKGSHSGMGSHSGSSPRHHVVHGHHVVLSTLDSSDATSASDELVQALHVLLPPRGAVVVIVQAVLAEQGLGATRQSSHGKGDGAGGAAGAAAAIAFGRVAITPTKGDNKGSLPLSEALAAYRSSSSRPQSHASAVQLLWRPPPPPLAALRLEPAMMTFAEVLVGSPADAAPHQTFEIINLCQQEINFMLMLQREEGDSGERAGGKKESKGGGDKGSGGERGGSERSGGLREKESIRDESKGDGSIAKRGEAAPKLVGSGEKLGGEKLSVGGAGREERREERREGRGLQGREREGGGVQSVPILLSVRNGFIAAGGKCAVEVKVVAPLPGWQRYVVVVRNLSQNLSGTRGLDTSLSLRVQGIHPNYLDFPDLRGSDAMVGEGGESVPKIAEGELAFGLCHIQQPPAGGGGGDSADGGAQVTVNARPYKRLLRITNLQGTPHKLTMTSNLHKQAAVFEDRDCTVPVTGQFQLEGKQTTSLWLCLQPHLSNDVLSGAVCRQLVGMIRVAILSADGDVIEEKPIRFSATFGRSKLRVGPPMVRFGRLPAPPSGTPPRVVSAVLQLSNLSEQIPLHWLSSSAPGFALRPPSGVVPGFGELATTVGASLAAPTPPPAAVGAVVNAAAAGEDVLGARAEAPRDKENTTEVRLSFTYSAPGFYREDMSVRDVNVPNEKKLISVEALVDAGVVGCSLAEGSGGDGLLVCALGTMHAALPSHVTSAGATFSVVHPPDAHSWPNSLSSSFCSHRDSERSSTAPSGGDSVLSATQSVADGGAGGEAPAHASPVRPAGGRVPARGSPGGRTSRNHTEVSSVEAHEGVEGWDVGGREDRAGDVQPILSRTQSEVASSILESESEPSAPPSESPSRDVSLSHMMLLPSAAAADGAHAYFTVTNTSDAPLRLLPTSDLPLSMIVVRGRDSALYADASLPADDHSSRADLMQAWGFGSAQPRRPSHDAPATTTQSRRDEQRSSRPADSLTAERRSQASNASDERDAKRSQSGHELLPVGEAFGLECGEEVQLRLRLRDVPTYLRREGGAAVKSASGGAAATGGTAAASVGGIVHRSQVSLDQALHSVLEFVGVLLLETVSTTSPPATLPAPAVAVAEPPSAAPSSESALVSTPSAPAVLAVRVQGSVCVSQMRLGDRTVRLGRVGYNTGWNDVPFQFVLLNQSPVATTCRVTRLPDLIELPNAYASYPARRPAPLPFPRTTM